MNTAPEAINMNTAPEAINVDTALVTFGHHHRGGDTSVVGQRQMPATDAALGGDRCDGA